MSHADLYVIHGIDRGQSGDDVLDGGHIPGAVLADPDALVQRLYPEFEDRRCVVTACETVIRELVGRLPECVIQIVLGHVGIIGTHDLITEGVQVEFVLLDHLVVEEYPDLGVGVILASDQLVGAHSSPDGIGDLLPTEVGGTQHRDGTRRGE